MFWRLVSTVLLLLPLTWGIRNAYRLYLNYGSARKIGVPIIVLPISPQNPIWMLLADIVVPVFQKFSITRSWPLIRFGRRAWEFGDKAKIHLELGDVLIMVTPDKNVLYICDAKTLAEVVQRRNEFKRPQEILKMLSVFGPNISTVSDEDWPRHKRATGPPFSNEQTNKLVWQEALRQTREMVSFWTSQGATAIRTTAEDVRTFSLNILTCAGFGKSYPFRASAESAKIAPNHSMSYKESLSLIIDNAILTLIIGPRLLLKWKKYLPKSWQEVAQATVEFKAYMAEMMQEERKLIAAGKPSKPNLMTSLIRASESDPEFEMDDLTPGHKQYGLSESEIFGNMFVFNFAGHDAVSHTFCYAIHLLAAHPDVQDWLSKEINAVFSDPDSSTWDYDLAFPRLNRCMAVMLETLRLYHPLVAFMKSTGSSPRTITYRSNQLHLPADTIVLPNLLGLQCHPRYWGSDSLDWRPSRWIIQSPGPKSDALAEELWTPPEGSFFPWSSGPRGCAGKDFSRIEFVSAMAGLFYNHRVKVVAEFGETQQQAVARVQSLVDDSAMVLLMQMMKPEKAGLRWTRNE